MCLNMLPKLFPKIIFIIGTETASKLVIKPAQILVGLGMPPYQEQKLQGEKLLQKVLIPSFLCIWVFLRDGKLQNCCALIIFYCKIH